MRAGRFVLWATSAAIAAGCVAWHSLPPNAPPIRFVVTTTLLIGSPNTCAITSCTSDGFWVEERTLMASNSPGEFDAISVLSSTQNPSEVQEVIAHVLGLPINKVVVTTKRMGGAFGGKECQATHPAAIAALVAHKTKRPARIAYSKDDDMRITGGRHPFQNDWKVAFTREGMITALKVDIYSDGGAYADLSTDVMGRAMTT